MSTSGSFAIIIAIIARWRIPPENSCGYCRTRTSGRGIPTDSSSSTARSIASCSLRSVRCARIASVICLPTRCTGFSAVSGSWKIIAIFAPRIVCRSFGLAPDQLLAAELRRARDRRGARQQPERREHRHRLARTRLADDAEHLARGDVEIDAPHRVDRTVLGLERHVQIADLAAPARRGTGAAHPAWQSSPVSIRTSRSSSSPQTDSCFGSSASRNPSPMKLTHSTVITIARPGAHTRYGYDVEQILASC